jgi:hypothetical protein
MIEYRKRFHQEIIFEEAFLNDYKAIHLALEVKSFIDSLSLRQISV